MKSLSVSEALIALGNGEKVTSDYLSENFAVVKFIYQTKAGIREDITDNIISAKSLAKVLQGENLRIYEEFVYPMWFNNIYPGNVIGICKFISLTHRIDLKSGKECNTSVPHTDKKHWKQVEEPKKMIKVHMIKFLSNKGRIIEADRSKLQYIPTKNIIKEYEIEVEDY